MKITWNTMLIQKEDGSLWYKVGDEEQPASPTDICRHYRNMQYNLDTTLGATMTDSIDKVNISEEQKEELFWTFEYCEMPDNCTRIK